MCVCLPLCCVSRRVTLLGLDLVTSHLTPLSRAFALLSWDRPQVERALVERGGGGGGGGQPLGLIGGGGEVESAAKLDEMKEEMDVSEQMHAGRE